MYLKLLGLYLDTLLISHNVAVCYTLNEKALQKELQHFMINRKNKFGTK